ncbi:MAG: NUDIX domain-containing protein [Candidatus Magasanikbacteria bacterium]|nr:NUDIX domain-containing protein [Candidatus Magasanikbacteria bacterium]
MEVKRIHTGSTILYIEGEGIRPEMRGGFMRDEIYSAAIDNMIIVCTDTVIIDRQGQTFYLAKRSVRPMAGLWWIGGRRNKGETPLEGMRRNFKREAGLGLPQERFSFVAMTEYLWQDRAQEPTEKGSHNLAHTFATELSPEELKIARKQLETREYDPLFGLQEFDRARLVEEDVHPVILDVYDLIFGNKE